MNAYPEDLASRFSQVEEAINKLKEGAASVRSNLTNSMYVPIFFSHVSNAQH